MRVIIRVLSIFVLCAFCFAPASTLASDEVTDDADGKWRVARDAFGPDHP